MTKAVLIREKDVERYLVHKCKEIGALCWKWVSPGRVGVPDRIVLWRGRIWFIELKSKGRKPRATQRVVFAMLERAGFPVKVLDNHDAVDHFMSRVMIECAC